MSERNQVSHKSTTKAVKKASEHLIGIKTKMQRTLITCIKTFVPGQELHRPENRRATRAPQMP